MDFSNLHYFITAASHSNLSHAAKELYISQPGLSKYLTKLENEVGVPLFERRKGKIVLNTYGKIFLGSVSLAYDQLNNGVEEIQHLYARDQNILSVACSIEDFLIDRLKEFSSIHPEIGIRQFAYSISEMETQLLKQNLDFAICAQPIANARIKYIKLSSCPWVIICHEENPIASKSTISIKELENQTFICETSRFSRKNLEMLCRGAGFTPRISHEIENGYILSNLLESNTGISLAPYAFYHKLIKHFPNSHLVARPIDDLQLSESEIGVAYLDNGVDTSSAKCFLEYLTSWAELESKEIILEYNPHSLCTSK